MKEIQEIAERLKGIREMEEISTAEMAECAGISENEYINYESGKKDFTFTLLYNCAKKLGIDITELLLGKSPNLSEYSIVRAGYGMKLKRREGFEYLHVAQYMKTALRSRLSLPPRISRRNRTRKFTFPAIRDRNSTLSWKAA